MFRLTYLRRLENMPMISKSDLTQSSREKSSNWGWNTHTQPNKHNQWNCFKLWAFWSLPPRRFQVHCLGCCWYFTQITFLQTIAKFFFLLKNDSHTRRCRMNTDLADSSEYAGVGHHLQDKRGFKQNAYMPAVSGTKAKTYNVEVFGQNIHFGKICHSVKVLWLFFAWPTPWYFLVISVFSTSELIISKLVT